MDNAMGQVGRSIQFCESGCAEWVGGRSPNGYGRTWFAGKSAQYAHRVVFVLWRGPIPAGLQIDHLCRNRACVNPLHLEPVTQAENIRRGVAGKLMAARNLAKTHCPRGHAYAGDNLVIDRDRRRCLECRRRQTRERMRAVRARQKGAA